MNIIQMLSISAIVASGVIAVFLLVYVVRLSFRWIKEDRAESAQKHTQTID